MVRAVLRLGHLAQWRALRQWRLFSTSRARVEGRRERLSALLARWRAPLASRIFLRWRDWATSHRSRRQEVLCRSLRRLLSSKLWTAWRQWRGLVEDERAVELRQALGTDAAQALKQALEVTRTERRKRASALIRAWQHQTVTVAFTGWKRVVFSSRSRREALMDRVLRRMVHFGLWRALRQWKECVEEERVRSVQTALLQVQSSKSQAMALRMLGRMRNELVSRAFSSWRQWVEGRRWRKRQVMSATLDRLGNLALWRGFSTWKRHVEEERVAELRCMLESAGSAMRATVYRARQGGEEFAAGLSVETLWALDSEHASLEEMRHAFQHVTHQLRESIREQKERRIAAMIQHQRMQRLVPCFVEWKEYVLERRTRKEQAAEKMLLVYAGSCRRRLWTAWQNFLDYSRIMELRQSFQTQAEHMRTQLRDQREHIQFLLDENEKLAMLHKTVLKSLTGA